MSPRDTDDAPSDAQDVDRPEGPGAGGDATEPTVRRPSRADLRRYQESMAEDTEGWHEVPVEDPAGSDPRSEVTPTRPVENPAPPFRGGTKAAGVPEPEPEATTEAEAKAHPEPTTEAKTKAQPEPEPPVVEPPTRVLTRPPSRQDSQPTMVVSPPTPVLAERPAAPVPEEVPELDPEAERRAEREARDRALGKRRPQPTATVVPDPPSTKLSRTTDRFPAALGLFLLRLVVAAVVGVHGAQQLLDMPATIAAFGQTALPYPEILAWATASGSVLIAVGLVFGFGVRIAGVGTTLIGVGALVFVYWWRPLFEAGRVGFLGETELLLAVIGVFFLLVGGGSWGVDAAIRKGRLVRTAQRYENDVI